MSKYACLKCGSQVSYPGAWYCDVHAPEANTVAKKDNDFVPKKKYDIVRNALKNWIEWEREQIKREGPYHGNAITALIADGEAALKATE